MRKYVIVIGIALIISISLVLLIKPEMSVTIRDVPAQCLWGKC